VIVPDRPVATPAWRAPAGTGKLHAFPTLSIT
jgi:hypothetical protein